MSQLVLTNDQIEGFERVRASNGLISLALIPELGGKISSLSDLRSGREWLWRHPRMAYARVAADASYVLEADTGGWDECFPTVAPCAYPQPPWTGVAVPDHGELWSQAVQLTTAVEVDQVSFTSHWQGRQLPYRFERRLTLFADRPALRCHYTVQNLATEPLAWIWCAHPLIAIEPGMRIRTPAEARFNVWAATPADLVPASSGLPFPPPAMHKGSPLDFGNLPPAPGAAIKLWSDPLQTEGWAAVEATDGALRMTWDVTLLPQLALWINLGTWAVDGGEPYYNLGLEPCIGAQDSLAEAVTRAQQYALLPAGATRSWWLEVELTAGVGEAHHRRP
jgi:galactose mutarotase-like enzyme